MKFKSWDKVRCIDSRYFENFLSEWAIYTVSHNWRGVMTSPWIFFNFNWYKQRFELVESSQEEEEEQSSYSLSIFRSIESLQEDQCIHCKTKEQAEYICKIFHAPFHYIVADWIYFYFRDWFLVDSRNINYWKDWYTILPATDFWAPSKETTITCDNAWLVFWQEITITEWERSEIVKICDERQCDWAELTIPQDYPRETPSSPSLSPKLSNITPFNLLDYI